MRKESIVLINNISYCRFPNGITNIEEFAAFLNANYHSFVELEQILEEGCVAPFFIEEDLKTKKNYWNPAQLRHFTGDEITILSREEYEEKLRKVIQEKCVHCIHYSDDSCQDDMKSFASHICLDGECYGYEAKKD